MTTFLLYVLAYLVIGFICAKIGFIVETKLLNGHRKNALETSMVVWLGWPLAIAMLVTFATVFLFALVIWPLAVTFQFLFSSAHIAIGRAMKWAIGGSDED